ncbi:MAG: NADH:ubiquinone reductase (Na(+)-transporting) subunit A, partial [Alistipes sp.]|nr:NADH:ubiquinone reductase (Na(+)-transporting) subunit A [Candidatus Minthomonas equi]
MTDYIKIKRGLDVPINGCPETRVIRDVVSHSIEIKQTDFRNLVPKLLVREGDRVLAGTPVFADKMRPEIKFASPVSGTVAAIVRGDKRKLLAVRVDADAERQSKTVNVPKLNSLKREQIIELMLENGLWPFIQQRPYGIIANPADTPTGIFISGFNTNPLAADYDYSLKDDFDAIQTGVDVLYKLLPEGIHFSLNTSNHASSPFHKLERVKFHVFDGPHPAGNVGVQIHHIAPVNKGEVVWCVELALLAVIGRFFTTGIYNASRFVAVGGPCAAQKGYIKCLPGVMMKDLADLAGSDGVTAHEGQEGRYISGSVLTGTNGGGEGSRGIFDTQIT